MTAIEFRLKISSMYSIRIPYSYQCARTYPLPAPSTIKGLCANALWRKEGMIDAPQTILETIHKSSVGATSRVEQSISVSACTVSSVDLSKKEGKKTDALLRQFAFTPFIDCMIVLRDKELCSRIAEALNVSPVYLGESESLVCVMPDSVNSHVQIKEVNEGETVEINSLFKFNFVKNNSVNEKGVVLYMQDDPCSPDAVLDRYIAPLKQRGDSYSPIESFSFITSKKCFVIKGKRLKGIFCETQKEPSKQKTKLTRKKKA